MLITQRRNADGFSPNLVAFYLVSAIRPSQSWVRYAGNVLQRRNRGVAVFGVIADDAGMPPSSFTAHLSDGPIEAEPPDSPEPPDVRLDVLAAVLDGVETAPYDDKVLGWLAGLDDPTYRTVASLLWRCRQAGLPGETGPA
jgi:hypothetical protein